MNSLFPVLTYKPTFEEVEVTCLAEKGQEIFKRVGKTNSFRQVLVFQSQGRKYVAKTYARPLGEIVWSDALIAKHSFEEAARYLPVTPTLFVYGREADRELERFVIRIQEFCPRRVCDLTDEELREPAMRQQMFDIIGRAERMIDEAGWLPDCFGHPAKPADIPFWPSLRRSTNIMINDRNEVVFVDINYPRPWNNRSNPVGRLALWGARQRLEDFKKFLV